MLNVWLQMQQSVEARMWTSGTSTRGKKERRKERKKERKKEGRKERNKKKERKEERKKELCLDSNDFGFIYAGAKGNDGADTLAGKVTLTSGLILGRSEVLRSLRHYLRSQSQGHHTIDRLEETDVERESARRSSLKGRERAIVSQTNIGTVSKATLGKLLRDG